MATKNSKRSLSKSSTSSMPPKKLKILEDQLAASSSEDEDVSSSEEETDLDEEKKQNLTNDEDEEDDEEETGDVPMKQAKNNMDDSDSESESNSESEKLKPVLASPEGLPGKSAAKRPALKMEQETKRAKTTEHGKKPHEEDGKILGSDTSKKQLFQRLFSDDDEIILLQGMVEFIGTIGDPYKDMEGFCKFIEKPLNCKASRAQIVDKIRRLNKKYDKGVERVYPKPHDQKSFDLWKKIWGKEGALHKEGMKRRKREMNVIGNSTNIVVSDKDVVSLFKKTGLDETEALQAWNQIEGSRKRQLEEKMKKLKVAEFEVCLKQIELTGEVGKEIYKKMKASHA